MSRKRKQKTATPKAAKAAVYGHKLHPDKPVAVLAGIGMLITGYLSFSSLGSDAPLFCGPESGCDVVQNSSYSTLFGLPLSLWGFGLYVIVLWSAITLPPRLKRWQRLAWLSTLGLGISLYLTITGLVALDAWCVWCMASLDTMIALFAMVMLRRPESGPGMPWLIFNRNLTLGTLFVVALLFAWQNGLLQPPEDPRLKALATHLDESDARFYGAFWCPSCQEQKRMFGRSADRLPYIECTPDGRAGGLAFECVANDISGYPTWIIDDRRYQQVLTPDELAARSGFVFDQEDEQ
ncbi:MAG: vitamin K epoxide reductase family protein [Wenzhouxiangellaceae bacterium]